MKLCVLCFCLPFFLLGFCFAISGRRSYFQESSCVSGYFWLQCTIFLHYPIGIGCICLIYHYSRFPCGILPVLHPDWCTWKQLLILPFRLGSLPPDELLVHFVHFWCTQCTGQLEKAFLPGSALRHKLQR